MKRNLIDAVLLVLGVLCASFGLKGFLLPNEFIDGGVTGISLLISELTQWPLSLLLVAINLPFIILGYSQIGREFSVKSILAIIGLALVVQYQRWKNPRMSAEGATAEEG